MPVAQELRVGTASPAPLVDRRANRLARALARFGVGTGARVAVLCCDDHVVDGEVARAATLRLRAESVVVLEDVWMRSAVVRSALQDPDPMVTLCCEHGHAARAAAGVHRGLVVGDAPGTHWWRLLELAKDEGPLP